MLELGLDPGGEPLPVEDDNKLAGLVALMVQLLDRVLEVGGPVDRQDHAQLRSRGEPDPRRLGHPSPARVEGVPAQGLAANSDARSFPFAGVGGVRQGGPARARR